MRKIIYTLGPYFHQPLPENLSMPNLNCRDFENNVSKRYSFPCQPELSNGTRLATNKITRPDLITQKQELLLFDSEYASKNDDLGK